MKEFIIEEQNQVLAPQAAEIIAATENQFSKVQVQPASNSPLSSEDTSQSTEKKKAKGKKEPNYMPNYTPEEGEKYAEVTRIHEFELERIGKDKTYHPLFDTNGKVVGIDVTEAAREGHLFVRPIANRQHGNDSKKTGQSLMTYGAQEALTLITVKVARAIGMKVEAFAGSTARKIVDEDLVVINGNGRMTFMYTIEPDQWPRILGTFVLPDHTGLIHPFRAFAEMNLNNTKWTAADMACKRLAIDNQPHEGWQMIQDLIADGYKYQAACQIVTLNTDRIKASAANSNSAEDLFADIEDAKALHKAVVHRFGKVEAIRGKFFTQIISKCWRSLRKEHGNQEATTRMKEFINELSAKVIGDIVEATSDRNTKKDQKRANILEDAFNKKFNQQN